MGAASILLAALLGDFASSPDWPMLRHDPGRTACAGTRVRPPLGAIWHFSPPGTYCPEVVAARGMAPLILRRGGASCVTALGLRYGHPLWEAPMPDGKEFHLVASGDRLLIVGGTVPLRGRKDPGRCQRRP